jgi:hypothetical protein
MFNLWNLLLQKKKIPVRHNLFFSVSFFLVLDPGSGMENKSEYGIRYKHPGSATLNIID